MNEPDNDVPEPPTAGDQGDLHPSGSDLLRDGSDTPYAFPHPQWTVGVVLVLAMLTLFLGVFGHPLWFLIGSPFIATFLVWLVVRITQRRRRAGADPDDEEYNY